MPLRFTELELRDVRIPFRFSFRHALAERAEARSLLVTLRTSSGAAGYGESVPRAYLTGESVDSAWDDLHRWWPRLRALEIPETGTVAAPLAALAPLYAEADAARKTAAYAALDVAAVDAWARSAGVSGRTLFGSTPAPVRLTAPLGSSSPKTTGRKAWLFRLLGFREFKIKLGVADDEAVLRAAKNALGAADLRADANAAWTPAQAIEKAKLLANLGVTSLEQPIPAGDAAALATVQREGGLPVMADESLCTRADAEALLREGAADLWNVRLAKVGGFSGLLEMIRLAKSAGVRLHFGVLVGETSLLAAAQRACLGLAAWAHVEYGFPRILLKDDPFRGGPGGYFGTGQALSDAPGLGVTPVPAALERITLRRALLN